VTIAIIDLDFFSASTTPRPIWRRSASSSRLVESQLRGSDMLCRYGGEEFCLLLREADSAHRRAQDRRHRRALPPAADPPGAAQLDGLHLSAGIAEYRSTARAATNC
jgi:diguanylate cyclase (GGDEF)-like protein